MKLFSKKIKETGRRHIYFLGVKIFSYSGRKLSAVKSVVELYKKNRKNNLLQDLALKVDCSNTWEMGKLFERYINHWDDINDLIYNKIPNEDKKTFLLFLMKRFAFINIITDEEKKKLDDLFQKVLDLCAQRSSVDDQLNINFQGINLKYQTNKEFGVKNLSEVDAFVYAYDIVHAFYLNEYYKKGFTPKDGEVIFDCGAAEGDTMLTFAVMYPNSPIYSFECNDGYKMVEINAKINNLKQVKVVHAFLDETTGTTLINGKKENTLSIDDFVEKNNITNIGLLKFDIEGAELATLKGAIKTIKKFRPILYIPIYHLESDVYEIPKFLNDLGMKTEFSIGWVENRIWGMDCVLFVKFKGTN